MVSLFPIWQLIYSIYIALSQGSITPSEGNSSIENNLKICAAVNYVSTSFWLHNYFVRSTPYISICAGPYNKELYTVYKYIVQFLPFRSVCSFHVPLTTRDCHILKLMSRTWRQKSISTNVLFLVQQAWGISTFLTTAPLVRIEGHQYASIL